MVSLPEPETAFLPGTAAALRLAALVDELRAVHASRPGSVGLAAAQIGHPRAVVIVNPTGRAPRVAVNPEVIHRSPSLGTRGEGCLSLPGRWSWVPRHRWIDVRYRTVDGQTIQARVQAFDARVWQHEIDHTYGLTIDRFPAAPASHEPEAE